MLEKSFQDELNQLKSAGLDRSLPKGEEATVENLSSNDYLGLSHHPQVIRAAQEALETYGTGGTSSRLLAGTRPLHRDLERNLATYTKKEAALVFSSGYHTNTGILPALSGPGDIIFFDRSCHASLLDGIRLSRATFASFDHNNADHLESLLRKRREGKKRAFVVTEGYFSMEGDAPPLAEICYLASKWNAYTYVDEAHSFGIAGPGGKGVAAAQGFLDKIDIFVGTLSKTLGSQGGFAAASQDIIDLLISRCRSFLFTTALAPAAAGAAGAALGLLPKLEDRREILLKSAEDLRKSLLNFGFDCLSSVSPIIPVWTGTIEQTQRLSKHLFNHGFFVPSIRPPTVPAGAGRVRVSMTFDAAQKGTRKLADVFALYSERPSRSGEKVVQTG